MVGKLSIGDQFCETRIRFRNNTDYEAYINSIDEGYDAEVCIFNGFIYEIDTPQLNLVNRSQFGNECDFKQQIFEFPGNICYIPTKSYCFIKCNNFLTGKDYKQQYLDFIRNGRRRSNIMTKARIQPFCGAKKNYLGNFDGIKVFPRSVTNRINAVFLHNNHSCLKCRSENVSFNKAIIEFKDNFKIVDNFITEESVNSHFIYDFIPKKIDSHPTSFLVYDLETHNTDRARPYCNSFYRLNKLAGK